MIAEEQERDGEQHRDHGDETLERVTRKKGRFTPCDCRDGFPSRQGSRALGVVRGGGSGRRSGSASRALDTLRTSAELTDASARRADEEAKDSPAETARGISCGTPCGTMADLRADSQRGWAAPTAVTAQNASGEVCRTTATPSVAAIVCTMMPRPAPSEDIPAPARPHQVVGYGRAAPGGHL